MLLEVVAELTGHMLGRTGPLVHGCLFFERGTQQRLHDDTWYALAGDEPGGMVGVWVALEDVDGDSGPLEYVPGSHLRGETYWNPSAGERVYALGVPADASEDDLAKLFVAQQLETDMLVAKLGKKTWDTARAGDVAIWHEHLVHGGGEIQNMTRTRQSLVVHFARRWLNEIELAQLFTDRLSEANWEPRSVLQAMSTLGHGIIDRTWLDVMLLKLDLPLPEKLRPTLLTALNTLMGLQ